MFFTISVQIWLEQLLKVNPSKQEAQRITIPYLYDNLHKFSYIMKCRKSCWLPQRKIIRRLLIIFQMFKCISSSPSGSSHRSTISKLVCLKKNEKIYPTPMRNVPLNSFPTAFPPNLPISCSVFNSKKKIMEFYLQDYHSAYTLNINLSLNRGERFMSK